MLMQFESNHGITSLHAQNLGFGDLYNPNIPVVNRGATDDARPHDN